MEGHDNGVARRTVLMSAGVGIGAGLVSGLSRAGGRRRRRGRSRNLEPGILGQQGRHEAQPLAQARRRAEARREAAADPVPGARLVELDALVLRSQRAGQRRIFADERLRARRLRRLDHGPRRLRLFRLVRQQFRHRQRRRGSQGRDAGDRQGDRPDRRCICTAPSSGAIRAAAFAQAQPDSVDRLVLSAFTYKGNGAEEIARRQKRIDELRANPRRKRDAIDDPLDLHPRRPPRLDRSGGARGDHRRGDEVRRHRSRPAPISTWRPTCRSSIRRRCSRRC